MSTETSARRRRVQLTPLPPLPVAFTGLRDAEGPLTLGQLNIVMWLNRTPEHFYNVLCVELEVPGGVSVGDVAETVAVLLARHEGLRTHYTGGTHPRQTVIAAGELMVDVHSLGDGEWDPRDRPAVAEALTRWLRDQRLAGGAGLPVRVAVAVGGADGRVVACAAGFSHVAVDHGALEIIRREFAGLVRDPSARQVGHPRHQPLDQAELEATPAERRQAEQALRYMEEQAWRIPRCLFALPGAQATGESLAVELSSVAAAMAVRRVAARTRSSRSSIVLAAICAVLAHRTGYRELTVPLLSNNRFERHLADFVGSLAQGAIATIEVGTASFDALVKHTWITVMQASRHARYDATRRAALDERIEHERGLRFMYDPLFNSLVPESWSGLTAGVGYGAEQVSAALAQTELTWRPVPTNGTPMRFGLTQIDGRVRLDLWSADTGHVPNAEMESLLLAVERLLVAAADGDLDTERITGAIGLDPILRGPEWTLVDYCWVDLAAAQRVLDEALAPAVARIFASVHGRPLVAYLTATGSVRTPEQAHARCMAALSDHPTALTPRHYVVCASAPPDPANPAAWGTIIADGTGR
ncbi:MAG: condensation domain-containing protein [Labedaea sp.]